MKKITLLLFKEYESKILRQKGRAIEVRAG